MNAPLKAFGVLAVIGATIGIFYGAGLLVYYWFFGVLTTFQHFAPIPSWLGVILMIIAMLMVGRLANLFFASCGIYAGIWLLGWSWFSTLALYATTAFVVFSIAFVGGVGALLAGLVLLVDSLRGR